MTTYAVHTHTYTRTSIIQIFAHTTQVQWLSRDDRTPQHCRTHSPNTGWSNDRSPQRLEANWCSLTYEIQAVATKALLSWTQKLLSIKSIQEICVYSSSSDAICFLCPYGLLLLNYRRHISGEIYFRLLKHVFFEKKRDWLLSKFRNVLPEGRKSGTNRYIKSKIPYQIRFFNEDFKIPNTINTSQEPQFVSSTHQSVMPNMKSSCSRFYEQRIKHTHIFWLPNSHTFLPT